MAAVSDMVPCGTVVVTGVALPAMCVRIDDTVGVQVRDARHWGPPFEDYHFLISKLVTGPPSRVAHNVENGLLVEISGETVARADFQEVQRLMEAARNTDFVILKFVPFQLIQPYMRGAVPSPPPPQFLLMDVMHDGNCFFYAAQQSVQHGRHQPAVGPESAAAQRTSLWRHFNAWWSTLTPPLRHKVLASYYKTYPSASNNGGDVTKEAYWLTPFKPVTEYQVRVWSDVTRIKVVVYTFFSKGSWLRVKSKRLVTQADLHETGRVHRMVIGPTYSQTIYLLHVTDREHGFEHYASLIPQPPSA